MSSTMKTLAGLSLCALAVAQDFQVTNLYTKQPNGNPQGQTNYYLIEFDVSSTIGDTPESAYCTKFWGDNYCYGSDCVAYSTNVPTGQFINCYQNESSFSSGDDATSPFAFQLYPYFSIGNFSIEIQKTYTETSNGVSSQHTAQSDPYKITNTTGSYNQTAPITCNINPTEAAYQQHASGDCTQRSNATISIPASHSSSSCIVDVTFPILKTTQWGENLFVVGNIPELGNWDVYNGVALNADKYSSISVQWDGGDALIPAGTSFEYKFIQWGLNANLTWECGPNRVYTIPADKCNQNAVYSGPQYFRDGDYQSCDLD